MYYLLFIFGFLFSFTKSSKISFYIYITLLILLACFKFGVGADYFSYNYLYELIKSNPIEEITNSQITQELLFSIMGSLFKSLGLPYQVFSAVIFSISIIFVGKLALDFSPKPIFTIFLYYCFFYFVWSYSALRQGPVLTIGVYYLIQWFDEKISVKKLCLIIIVLSLFHTSSLIILVYILLLGFNWNKKRLLLFNLIAITLSVIPTYQIIIRFISIIPFFNRYITYFPTDTGIINIFDIQTISRMVFLIIAYIYYESFASTQFKRKLINLFILSLCLYFLFKGSEIVAGRISIYGFYTIIIIIPLIYHTHKNKLNKAIFFLGIAIFSVMYFSKELNAMFFASDITFTSNKIIQPYTHIFNKYDEYYFTNYFEYIIRNMN